MFHHGFFLPGLLWTPAEITTTAWFDASDTSTITHSSGSVSQWDDKSGNDNDVIQSTGSNQPTTGTRTINSLNVLDFDGDNRLLRDNTDVANMFPVGNKIFIASVVEHDTTSQDLIAYFNESTSGLTAGGDYNGAGGNLLEVHWDATAGTNARLIAEDRNYVTTGVQASYTTSPPSTATPYILGGELDRSQSLLYAYAGVNGDYTSSATGAGAALDTAASLFVIGGHGSSDTTLERLHDGKLGEMVIVHDISSDDRLKLEGYLAHKWGLEGSLPSGHLYKNNPPYV